MWRVRLHIGFSFLILSVIDNDDAFIQEKTSVLLLQESERAQWGEKIIVFHPLSFVSWKVLFNLIFKCIIIQ